MSSATRSSLKVVSYADKLSEPIHTRRLPGLGSTLILNIGDPFVIEDARGDKVTVGTDEGFLSTLSPSFCVTQMRGTQIGVQLDIPYELASTLMGDGRFTSQIKIRDSEHSPIGKAFSRRRAKGTALSLVSEALGYADTIPKNLTKIAQELAVNPNKPIGVLASELGWNRRKLANKFSEFFGVTPKTFARIARFELLIQRVIEEKDWPDLSELALEFGFYDQSHLANEVQKMSGSSITQLMPELNQ